MSVWVVPACLETSQEKGGCPPSPERGPTGEGGRSGRARDGGYAGVQVTGDGTELLPLPVKPKLVVAPGASDPFQDRFFTVTLDPLWLSVPLHSWEML